MKPLTLAAAVSLVGFLLAPAALADSYSGNILVGVPGLTITCRCELDTADVFELLPTSIARPFVFEFASPAYSMVSLCFRDGPGRDGTTVTCEGVENDPTVRTVVEAAGGRDNAFQTPYAGTVPAWATHASVSVMAGADVTWTLETE